jgi:nucleotide-binding universal stress UspA family protein
MYRRMLVPTDGSELAEGALAYAAQVAGRMGLEVLLLNVIGPEEHEQYPMHQAYIQDAAEALARQMKDALHKAGVSKGRRPPVRCEVAIGHAAEEILHCADRSGTDFILMATHGRSGIRRWAMGSVADKVLRASVAPVWLIRAGLPNRVVYDTSPVTSILVPLDGSELAAAAVPYAEALAEQRDATQVEVVLLSVCRIGPIPDYYPSVVASNWGDHIDECRRAADQYLAGLGKSLEGKGLRVRWEVLLGMPDAGNPADAIVEYANRNRCDLIVMSTHGRSGLSRWALGSVADRIVQGASEPVFLIRSGSRPGSARRQARAAVPVQAH